MFTVILLLLHPGLVTLSWTSPFFGELALAVSDNPEALEPSLAFNRAGLGGEIINKPHRRLVITL